MEKKLSQLIDGIDAVIEVTGDAMITDVVHDSRQVKPGALFVAMPGINVNGKSFISKAIEAGAVAVMYDGGGEFPDAVNLRVTDVKDVLGTVAHRFFDDPSATMTVVGITGTNGKTTTTYLVEAILAAAGKKVGVIGTVNYRFAGQELPAPNTTPLGSDIARLLATMKQQGVDTVVMEVSSHALDQNRVLGLNFDIGCFSNLSRDHLDYHTDLDEYFQAKQLLFNRFMPASIKENKLACINLDDPAGVRMAAQSRTTVSSYGLAPEADIRMENIRLDFSGFTGTLTFPEGKFEIHSPLLGDFSVSNVLAASAICLGLGVAPEIIVAGVKSTTRVPGRLDPVENSAGFLVLVDYAHTPEALVNVLDSLNRLKKGRIITVFGCGGDRDPGKRPLMGEAAAKRSDVTVVTSDNPRTESPDAIIEQILDGIRPLNLESIRPERLSTYSKGRGLIVEVDRRKAIALAVAGANKGDIVLVAGKGHEDYQIIGRVKTPFDDRVEAAKALSLRNEIVSE